MKKILITLLLSGLASNIVFAKSQQRKIAQDQSSNVEIYVEVIKKQFNCVGKCFEGKVFKLKKTPDKTLSVSLDNITCRVSVADLVLNIADVYVTLEEQGKQMASAQSTLNPVKANVEELFDELLLKGSGEAVCAVSLRVK